MPVPRRRHCRSRQGKDRAHKKLYVPQLVPCEQCGAPLHADARFCNHCGAALAKTKECPGCGELNDPDARFCDNCGQQIG